MGGEQSSSQSFNQSNWREVSSPFSEITQFQHLQDRSVHIQRHLITTVSQDQYDHIKEISFVRKNNPKWVSALYFEERQSQKTEFCASKYEAYLYLEKIPIRLCDLHDIPFPDALHLYDQVLTGYYDLARFIGCFPVESDYIGINQRGVVKVWAGAKWARIDVKGGVISQEDMVRGLVECLEESIDKQSMPPQNPSIRNFLYRTADRINFQQAISQLRNFSRVTNMGKIPTKLNSIEDSPGRYDTDRINNYLTHIEHPTFPVSQSSSQVPYSSPRFIAHPEQITTFRRVDSLHNESMHKATPVSQFANRERAVSQIPQTIDRSPSQPQLINGYMLRPNSSLRELAPTSIVMNRIPEPQRPSITSHTSPQVSQQFINSIYQPISYNPNPPRSRAVSYKNEEIRPVVREQPVFAPVYSPTNFSRNNPNQIPRDTFQPPTIKQLPDSYPQGQSIIMQLYNSQDNRNNNNNNSSDPSKHFGFVKRADSVQAELPKRFDSVTIINQNMPDSMKGIPAGQGRFLTPNNKDLNSIEEVHTEHFWKETGSKQNSAIKGNEQPESLSFLVQANERPKPQIAMKSKYAVIDENDGKSSDDFLKKLKEFSSVTPTYSSQPQNNYQKGYQKKKSVAFLDSPSHTRNKQYNFGRSAESKHDSNDNTSRPYENHYQSSIDPDVWADLQKMKT